MTFGKASIRRVAAVLLPLVLPAASGSAPPAFDLVLTGGRVIDPETALDAIRDVGIRGDTVAQVSTEPLAGARTIDASGLVAPGFIDLHQHGQRDDAYLLNWRSTG